MLLSLGRFGICTHPAAKQWTVIGGEMVPESRTERGRSASVAKITISTIDNKSVKEVKCSFQIYTYCFFYLHFWPRNKVLFRVKILPVPFSATLECSKLNGIIYSFVIL